MKKYLSEDSNDPYFNNYINLVQEDNLKAAYLAQQSLIDNFFSSISEEQSCFAYAEGKWSIKELLLHIIDCERIFAYRALCIARGEQQHLPGFEENDYARNSEANERPWGNIIAELQAVRKSTLFLVAGLAEEAITLKGTASGRSLTAAAALYITVGHLYHHVNVIKERYLPSGITSSIK